MKVTLACLVVLLVRSESEKTPLTVLPHEVEVLKALHGEDAIRETDAEPPVKEVTFDTADEYGRLEQMYRGDVAGLSPTRAALGDLEEFEASFKNVDSGDNGDNEDEARQAELIEEAKALGIKATKNWGIPKLEEAIAQARENQE